MILDDESWLLVRTTQGVTAFIGAGNKPTPISEKEVQAIQKIHELEEPSLQNGFLLKVRRSRSSTDLFPISWSS